MVKAITKFQINRCFKAGRYVDALEKLKPLARKGDARAQFLIGMVYSNAWIDIGDNDTFMAEKWFSRAAENGHQTAQLMLGDLYAIDAHIPARLHRAIKWYRKANRNGHSEAGRKLAALYFKHRDVIAEDINTTGLLIEAADNGDYKAAVLLAWGYKKGSCGLPEDINRFYYWWNKLKNMSKTPSSSLSNQELLQY